MWPSRCCYVCHTLSWLVPRGPQQSVPAQCLPCFGMASTLLCVQSLCTLSPLSLAHIKHSSAFGDLALAACVAGQHCCTQWMPSPWNGTAMVVLPLWYCHGGIAKAGISPVLVVMAGPRHCCVHVLCEVVWQSVMAPCRVWFSCGHGTGCQALWTCVMKVPGVCILWMPVYDIALLRHCSA